MKLGQEGAADCGCAWDGGQWFPCHEHRHLSQQDLEALFRNEELRVSSTGKVS